MPTVRTAKHLLLESTTKSVESGTYDVICQFCTVKGVVVESEVLKAQSCALSNLGLPVHSNVAIFFKIFAAEDSCRVGSYSFWNTGLSYDLVGNS